ncbi:AraC family transcriptional regulator [Marinomonas sp. CT5]|uniref:AraC family transcriptional regulator n=1 Tax=Marinomonas sp. CT5 TaxID=2066133 RepID=UPI0017A5155F|nr:AraC family transcriptional regulator [Marinomonas sp. CT5]NVK72033.1 AraC family transcriptional regulator [Oceanospirillaceae bacterium]
MKFDFSIFDLQIEDASAQTLAGLLLNKGFGKHHLVQSAHHKKTAALRYKEFGPLSIIEYAAGVPTHISSSKLPDAYFLHVILAGRSTVQNHDSKHTLKSNDSIVIMPKAHFISNDSADCKKLIVKIPADFFHQTAREFGYVSTLNPIQFDTKVNQFPTFGPLFNLLNDMLQQDKTELYERALIYYCRLLSSAILHMFNSHIYQNSTSNESLHRHIGRIRNYVLDNITTDITIDELASLCEISRKSLYNLFERETGLTPSAYVRSLKLESAYAELKSNEHIKNVTQVALKYGFTNLGRFSAQYREQIGELPSQTLREFSN